MEGPVLTHNEKAPDAAVGGANKKDVGKLRFDLLPPVPMMYVGEVYSIGAKKYGDHNWRKGMSWGRVFAAMLRHAFNWWAGQRNDPVDGQHHLASVAWCALTLMQYEIDHPKMDDRYKECDDKPV